MPTSFITRVFKKIGLTFPSADTVNPSILFSIRSIVWTSSRMLSKFQTRIDLSIEDEIIWFVATTCSPIILPKCASRHFTIFPFSVSHANRLCLTAATTYRPSLVTTIGLLRQILLGMFRTPSGKRSSFRETSLRVQSLYPPATIATRNRWSSKRFKE